jgi:hypothetical protein
MGQRAWCSALYIYSCPITSLWIDSTMHSIACRTDQIQIVVSPMMLTFGTYELLFCVQSFCLTFRLSLLTANIPFLSIINCIQNHQGCWVSEPPLNTSSVR